MSHLRCINCGKEYDTTRKYFRCDHCGDLLEVVNEVNELHFSRFKGVWKYKEIIYPEVDENLIVTRGEGDTNLYNHLKISEYAGVKNLFLKHEGENPTGSFKDRGMTVAITHGRFLGVKETICASTGNTSASAASYSSLAGLKSNVLVPEGKISRSKLIQTLAYGANIVQVKGDFDKAMEELEAVARENKNFYILNSINPWRIEGQKTIFYEIMDQLKEIDFMVVPAGNLGNTSALGKAIKDYFELGILKKKPRIISVQAEGASPFYKMWKEGKESITPMKPETIASAIRIGNPVNWKKAIRAIKYTDGLVTTVTDAEIMEAKRIIDSSGIGAEPASSATLAGIRKMREEGVIEKDDVVAGVLTGHLLKDIDNINAENKIMDVDEFMASINANSN